MIGSILLGIGCISISAIILILCLCKSGRLQ